jgi:hypothetical protein
MRFRHKNINGLAILSEVVRPVNPWRDTLRRDFVPHICFSVFGSAIFLDWCQATAELDSPTLFPLGWYATASAITLSCKPLSRMDVLASQIEPHPPAYLLRHYLAPAHTLLVPLGKCILRHSGGVLREPTHLKDCKNCRFGCPQLVGHLPCFLKTLALPSCFQKSFKNGFQNSKPAFHRSRWRPTPRS